MQFDARSLDLEQAWLESLGSVRHSLVAPCLISAARKQAHRPRCGGREEHQGENAAHRRSRIEAQLVCHPRRKAGKGVVKLVHNEKRGAASLKPCPDAYCLAKAGMKSIGDACFSLLFAGSMSPFRAAPGSH